MFLPRSSQARLEMLLAHFPVVVITGARQVGKSTLLRHHLGESAEFVVFDPVVDVENARRDPELFLENHITPLVLDEVQYASELLPALKRRVDRDRRPGQYILTGSQQWGVLRTVAESLAGRAVFLDLDGFTLAEAAGVGERPHWLHRWLEIADTPSGPRTFERLAPRHGLLETLWRGALPDAQLLPREAIADFQAAYQRTYIERDVRLLADVSDWQQFGRFMRLAAALTAQTVNFSQLGREIGVTPQTAGRWLDLLKATFQWFEVPSYSGNTIKRVASKPKGYIADTGIACMSLALSGPAALPAHPQWGPIFETAVFAEVRKAAALMSPAPKLHHWRTGAGAEVDLLLERDGVFFPIEVKAASRASRHDLSGIHAFSRTYPHLRVAPGLVVCPCEAFARVAEDAWTMPWDATPID
ncbi:ATP-binding protein [Myxococcota bacterium]|nr:ATP-binding protein [Myxococcota bacterium]MBU1411615.1 ATP-binding protein [Myxococcota bacterium]MBU1509061.1 ATP-binding protein [Myxococcota bacterium]